MSNPEVLQMLIDDQGILLEMQDKELYYLRDEVDRLQTLISTDKAEIERLKADLAQVRAAITKLSREIWKVC